MIETKFVPIIEFKEHGLVNQFRSPELDNRLLVIAYALAGFIYYNFGKSITITEIFRTQEMQDTYYKNNVHYQIKPFKSVHQLWRGIDLSIKYYTNDELKEIMNFLNNQFDYGDGIHETALIHDISLGNHLHIQVSPKIMTMIKKGGLV